MVCVGEAKQFTEFLPSSLLHIYLHDDDDDDNHVDFFFCVQQNSSSLNSNEIYNCFFFAFFPSLCIFVVIHVVQFCFDLQHILWVTLCFTCMLFCMLYRPSRSGVCCVCFCESECVRLRCFFYMHILFSLYFRYS